MSENGHHKLTIKQERFIHEYLLSGNATDAARKAGYKGNDLTLKAVGAENLSKPYLKQAIDNRRAELKKTAEFKEEQIRKAFEEIAQGSVFDEFYSNGRIDLDAVKAARKGNQLTFQVVETLSPDGKTIQTKVAPYSRIDALRALVDIYGMKQQDRPNETEAAYQMFKQSVERVAAQHNASVPEVVQAMLELKTDWNPVIRERALKELGSIG